MATTITLSTDILNHFNISHYSAPKKGGQKTVFYVKINNVDYALKIINVNDARFQRELSICKRFQENDGIPKIFTVEDYHGDTIIIEEFIDGNDLNDILPRYFNDEDKICDLITNIIDILTPVWKENFVHRDLKPQNIRIRNSGLPVILDFGIARALDENSLTVTGTQPLSYLFGSPEQYAGNKSLISYRTDFFSLGIIAYYLFTSKLPFGFDKNDISKAFQKNKIDVTLSSKKIEDFCNAIFKINPSERPRTPEFLMKYLTK